MWSFVKTRPNKTWNWFTIDVETNEIIGVFIGSRDAVGAQGLWNSLSPVYRQCATVYTDFWDAYQQIIPLKRHKPVKNKPGVAKSFAYPLLQY